MVNYILVEEFISKYEKHYEIEADDYNKFINLYLKNGVTNFSKDITYAYSEVKMFKENAFNVTNVPLNIMELFVLDKSIYSNFSIICEAVNNKNIMVYFIKALKKYQTHHNLTSFQVKDLEDVDNFRFFPYQVNYKFEEGYDLTLDLIHIFNATKSDEMKNTLKVLIQRITQSKSVSKYGLDIHSITKNPTDKDTR